MIEKDGGSAFPSVHPLYKMDTRTGDVTVEANGMSLYDYFAGQAMIGIIMADTNAQLNEEDTAQIAYQQANAMIIERERRKNDNQRTTK